MKFILTVVSFLAVGSGGVAVAASTQQAQEVQHRLLRGGGVPAASTTKNVVEERRLEEDSEVVDAVWDLVEDVVADVVEDFFPSSSPSKSPTKSPVPSTSPSSSDREDYSNVVATDMNATSSSSTSSSEMEDDTDAAAAAAATSSGDSCASITDTVCAMEGVTVFCELLQNPTRRHLAALDAFGFDDASEEFTLFVPTDAAFALIADAFETLTDAEAGRVIMFHLYSGMLLTSDKLKCRETITSMNDRSDASRTKCIGDKKYQNGNGNHKTGSMSEINTTDHLACNGVIHTLDHVMFPVSLAQLHADYGSDTGASTSSDDSDNSDTAAAAAAADAEVIQTSPPTTDGNATSSQEYSNDGDDGDAADSTAVDITLPPTVDDGALLSKGTVDDGAPLILSRVTMCPGQVFEFHSPACNYQAVESPVMDQACICNDALTLCQIGSDQESYCA